MACNKIQTVLDWPELQKVKDIQSFLGFANFYHRFIQGYSDIVGPLTCLTRKGVPWNFSDDWQKSFLHLKDAFTFALVLIHWTPNAPITVETNTSNYVKQPNKPVEVLWGIRVRALLLVKATVKRGLGCAVYWHLGLWSSS